MPSSKGTEPSQLAAIPVSRQRIVMLVAREDGADLEQLSGFVERGQLSPHVDRVVGLAGVADAMRALERGEVTGKIVVVP